MTKNLSLGMKVQLYTFGILCGNGRSSAIVSLPMSAFGFFGTSNSHNIKMEDFTATRVCSSRVKPKMSG